MAEAACKRQHHFQQHLQQQQELQLLCAVWQQQPCRSIVQQLQLTGTKDQQHAVLDALCSPVCQAVPPGAAYVARLAKQLITAAEDAGHELSEPLLQLQVALLQQHHHQPVLQGSIGCAAAAADEAAGAGWRWKTFLYASSRCCSMSAHNLQLLQQHHAGCVSAAAAFQAQGGNSEHGGGSWVLPMPFQQRLQQQQRALQQLLAAAGLVQQKQSDAIRANDRPNNHHKRHSSQQQEQGPPTVSSHTAAGLLTINSSDNLFEGGTGCFMWDASFPLAEWVLNHPDVFADKRVLEVGCGPGLVAACVCRVGARRVLLSDGDPQTLVNCLSNLALNGHHSGAALLGSWREAVQEHGQQLMQQMQSPETEAAVESSRASQHAPEAATTAALTPSEFPRVRAFPLDWSECVPGLAAAVDVIVASDVCYDPAAVPSLVALLAQVLVPAAAAAAAAAGPGVVAYICTTKRAPTTLQLFLDLAAAAGLRVTELPLHPQQWRQQQHSGAGGAVIFQHLPALADEGARERYVLHEVRACDSSARV